jgi:hypothetical protein
MSGASILSAELPAIGRVPRVRAERPHDRRVPGVGGVSGALSPVLSGAAGLSGRSLEVPAAAQVPAVLPAPGGLSGGSVPVPEGLSADLPAPSGLSGGSRQVPGASVLSSELPAP